MLALVLGVLLVVFLGVLGSLWTSIPCFRSRALLLLNQVLIFSMGLSSLIPNSVIIDLVGNLFCLYSPSRIFFSSALNTLAPLRGSPLLEPLEPFPLLFPEEMLLLLGGDGEEATSTAASKEFIFTLVGLSWESWAAGRMVSPGHYLKARVYPLRNRLQPITTLTL